MGRKDELCEFMRVACEDWSLGYSQGSTRWNVWDGGECDCASLAITAAKKAGYDTGGASYTGDMIPEMQAKGWQVLPYSLGAMRRGDMPIRPKTANRGGHVAVCIDENNQGNKIIAEALMNEYGGATGGKPGDQTGQETRCTIMYPFATYLLRPPADSGETPSQGGGVSKLYIICGHGAGDPGASGNGCNEAERVRALGKRIKELGGNNVTLLDVGRNWYADSGINSLSIPKDSALVELHMDSSDSSSARGGHVIIKQGFSADSYDTALAALMARLFPGRANTIVGRSDLANVNRAANRGINYRLVENGFITNKGDIDTFNGRLDELARGYLTAFGIDVEPAPAPAPAPKPKPVPIAKREPGGAITGMRTINGKIYRVHNPYNGDHLYTADENEKNTLVSGGYDDEGVIGKTPSDIVVVYRLYNIESGEHLYTADYNEATDLVKKSANLSDGTLHGWQSEGEPFLAYAPFTPGKEPVYRLYKPGGFHHFTRDANEIAALTSDQGYRNEGVKFCVDPTE